MSANNRQAGMSQVIQNSLRCWIAAILCAPIFLAAPGAWAAYLISVDGIKDSFWNTATGQVHLGLPDVKDGHVDSEDDLSGDLYLAWDSNFLYGFTEIQDDVIGSKNNGGWQWNDAISLKFDPNPTSSIGVPDMSKIVSIAITAEGGFPACSNGSAGTILARTKTGTGYTLEFAIPFGDIVNNATSPIETITPIVGVQTGFALELDDQDNQDQREGQMVWGHSTKSHDFWEDVTELGNIKLLANNQVEFSTTNLAMPAETPVLNSPVVRSRHWMWGSGVESWGVDCWVYASDQQGYSDIDSVCVDGPNGFHRRLLDDGAHYDQNANDGLFSYWDVIPGPATLGRYEFKVRDKAGHLTVTADTLKAVLNPPHIVTPAYNAIVSDAAFQIDWDPVAGATGYHITIWNQEETHSCWSYGLGSSESSVIYNQDGKGEALSPGIYSLWVQAYDGDQDMGERLHVMIHYQPEGMLVNVDGTKDAFYGTLTGPDDGYLQIRSFAYNDVGRPANDADLSAKVWASWDGLWFYLYEEVMDDTISGNAPNVWEQDAIELKFDPQPTDSAANSIWDARLTALGMETAGVVNADSLNNIPDYLKKWARKPIPGGYALEMAIDWSIIKSGTEIISPAVGSIFGMAMKQHDNDGQARRQAIVQWAAVMRDAVWNTPKYLGTVQFLADHKLKFIPANNMTGARNRIPYDGSDYVRPGMVYHVDYLNASGIENGSLAHPFNTIKEGIDATSPSDTVLVHPGLYHERLNLYNKNIILGSFTLTTGDTSYISQTIIDGNREGSVICIGEYITDETLIKGFTIRNGEGDGGGGINIYRSNIRLEDLIITDNRAYSAGGGIHCHEASPTLKNLSIINNFCDQYGGGITLYNASHASLIRVRIENNRAAYAGGTNIQQFSNPYFKNVTICNNTQNENSGAGAGVNCGHGNRPVFENTTISHNTGGYIGSLELYDNVHATLKNCILFSNLDCEIELVDWQAICSVTIAYSNIKGGQGKIRLANNGIINWGVGNLDSYAFFIDPINRDFHLQLGSPCINAGDPNPSCNDKDGSRNDMGAFGGPAGESYAYIDGPPIIEQVSVTPQITIPGNSVVIRAKVTDAAGTVANVSVAVEVPDGVPFQGFDLYDDGNHGDDNASDHIWANSFVTDMTPLIYYADVIARDNVGHIKKADNAVIFYTDVSLLPVQLTDDVRNESSPAICQTPTGRIIVAYGKTSIWLQTSDDGGTHWSAPREVVSGNTNDNPSIAATSNGTVIAAYGRDGDVWYRTSHDNGESWSSEIKLTNSADYEYWPRIGAGPNGKAAITWTNSNQRKIYYAVSADHGATWSGGRQFALDAGTCYSSCIEYNPLDGRLHLIWSGTQSGNYDLWHSESSDEGNTWSAPERITTNSASDYMPEMDIDASGKIWVAWYSYRNNNEDIYYTHTGSSWAQETRLTRYAGGDISPAVEIVNGSPFVVWYSNRAGNYDIWKGILDHTLDLNPPPSVISWGQSPKTPDPDDHINITVNVQDESGVRKTELIYWVNGAGQPAIQMNDAGNGQYACSIGPYALATHVDYQIRATDVDGNIVKVPSDTAGFDVVPFFQKSQDILIVADASTGQHLNYYTGALTANGYAHDVWEVYSRGGIDSTVLKQYKNGAVVWYCGWSYPALDGADKQNIAAYLKAGGRLFITDQDIGWQLNQYIPDVSWYETYLHAHYAQDNSGITHLNGVTGDPVSDGLSIAIWGGDGANNQYYPDEIDPISPAVGVLYYDGEGGGAIPQPSPGRIMDGTTDPDDATGQAGYRGSAGQAPPRSNGIASSGCGALRIDTGVYRLVYFAFGFEGISSAQDRSAVMKRVVDWLKPPGWSASLAVTGNNGTSIALAIGGHPSATNGLDNGLDVIAPPVPQTYYAYFNIGVFPNSLYTDIRGWVPPFNQNIDWTLKVVNADGVSTTITWNPADLPSQGNFTITGAGSVNMRTTGTFGFTGNKTLTIQYRLATTVNYTFAQAGWYMVSLPVIPADSSVSTLFPAALGGMAFGWDAQSGTYTTETKMKPKKGYWLAIPSSASSAVNGLPLNSYTDHFAAQGWYMIGSVLGTVNFLNPNDTPGGSVLSPAFGWNSASGTYEPATTLNEKEGYWIAVFNACDLTVGGSGGESPAPLAKADWEAFYQKYGKTPPAPPTMDGQTPKAMKTPKEYGLFQNYPNPFNPETTIGYQIPDAGFVRLVIYNTMGQAVRTLVDGHQNPGSYEAVWDGKDGNGINQVSGMYLCRIQAGPFSSMVKLVLMK
jgi:hypothetical protein